MRDKVFLIIRAIVSLTLIAYLLTKVDFRQIVHIMSSVNLYLLFFSMVLYFIIFFLVVLRWGFLLHIYFPKQKYITLLQYHWIGQFFSLFLPSMFGGDLFKIYIITKKHGHALKATMVSLYDRFIGLCSLVILATVAMLLNNLFFKLTIPIYFSYLVKIFWVLFAFLIILTVTVEKKFTFKKILKYNLKLDKFLQKIEKNSATIMSHKQNFGKALAMSLVVSYVVATASILLAAAIKINVPVIYFYIIYSII